MLDYSSMFTRLAYSEIGATPPEGDLYAVPGFEGYRSGIKMAMNTLLFGAGTRKKWPSSIGIGVGDDKDAEDEPDGVAAQHDARLPKGSTVKKTKDAILSAHPALPTAWGRRLGYKLMFLESEILIEVLQQLASRDIPALGLHDGLLVARSRAQEGMEVMKEVGRKFSGLPLPVSICR